MQSAILACATSLSILRGGEGSPSGSTRPRWVGRCVGPRCKGAVRLETVRRDTAGENSVSHSNSKLVVRRGRLDDGDDDGRRGDERERRQQPTATPRQLGSWHSHVSVLLG